MPQKLIKVLKHLSLGNTAAPQSDDSGFGNGPRCSPSSSECNVVSVLQKQGSIAALRFQWDKKSFWFRWAVKELLCLQHLRLRFQGRR